jgi:hypothetical protein
MAAAVEHGPWQLSGQEKGWHQTEHWPTAVCKVGLEMTNPHSVTPNGTPHTCGHPLEGQQHSNACHSVGHADLHTPAHQAHRGIGPRCLDGFV